MHQHIWKSQQWSQNWKRSVFIPIPKKGNAKECSQYHTIALISHASKVKLARECPDVQAGSRKVEELDIKLPHSSDIRESKGIPEKHLLLLH